MSAVRFARAIAAVALAAGLGASCSSDRVAPSGSTPVSLPIAPAPVVTDAATTTQVPTADTPRVRQAVEDYWNALRQCQQRPSSCRPATFTSESGPLRTDVTSAVDTMVTNGWYRAAGDADDDADPRSDGGYVVVGAVTVDVSGTTATAEACVNDPDPVLGPGDAVISTGSGAHHIVHTLYLEGQTWRVGDVQIDPATDACDTAPDTIPPDVTTPGS